MVLSARGVWQYGVLALTRRTPVCQRRLTCCVRSRVIPAGAAAQRAVTRTARVVQNYMLSQQRRGTASARVSRASVARACTCMLEADGRGTAGSPAMISGAIRRRESLAQPRRSARSSGWSAIRSLCCRRPLRASACCVMEPGVSTIVVMIPRRQDVLHRMGSAQRDSALTLCLPDATCSCVSATAAPIAWGRTKSLGGYRKHRSSVCRR